jgi:RNA polymerase sigma factor (TIGR02999 family)
MLMSAHSGGSAIEQLMADLRHGSREAADELTELLWPELRRMAAAQMKGERTDHTWQPTALVNELYLELVNARGLGSEGVIRRNDKNAFLGLAAHMMRRLLIHHARPLHRRVRRVPIGDEDSSAELAIQALNDIEDLLAGLAKINPQLRTVVEMKVFEGLSLQEIAAGLGCSHRTVERRWTLAKHWLEKEFE